MVITITGSPMFKLPLSQRQIRLFRMISTVHYDARCREAGQVGGFLYGWAMGGPIDGSAHKMGLLLKLGEYSFPLGVHEAKEVGDICRSIRRAMEMADIFRDRWVEEVS